MWSKPIFVRKLTSVLLIAVFAIGITPVVLLHNIFANHTDVSYHNESVKGDAISKAGINCHCISFVAESHFYSSLSTFAFSSPAVIGKAANEYYKQEYPSQQFYVAGLRGPPFIG